MHPQQLQDHVLLIKRANESEIDIEVQDSSLRVYFSAESLSCTGPVVGLLQFPRFILHKLEVGPETVTIELAEAVE